MNGARAVGEQHDAAAEDGGHRAEPRDTQQDKLAVGAGPWAGWADGDASFANPLDTSGITIKNKRKLLF